MTKALLEKKRGGARAKGTKLEPEHLDTAEKLSTAQDTLALTVRALRELLSRAYPELRLKTISISRLNAVLVHELNIMIKKLTLMAREGLTEVNLAKRKAYRTQTARSYFSGRPICRGLPLLWPPRNLCSSTFEQMPRKVQEGHARLYGREIQQCRRTTRKMSFCFNPPCPDLLPWKRVVEGHAGVGLGTVPDREPDPLDLEEPGHLLSVALDHGVLKIVCCQGPHPPWTPVVKDADDAPICS
jgi:hypothetical protein